MSNLTKGLILLLVILGIGAGLVFWKSKVGGHSDGGFNSISKADVEMLLADVAKSNPMVLKRFAEDPKLKKTQLDNLKQLLAFASQAEREGLVNEQPYRQEMENIRSEVIAVNYDREINKDKGPMPPFGFITEDRVKAFWGEGEQPQKSFFDSLKDRIGLGKRDNELAFQKFLDTKVTLLKEGNPQMKDREISEEERTQARDFFAKIEIYEQEYIDKVDANEIPKEFQDKVKLQLKLQQAQFLARIYSDKSAEKMKVTDEDVDKYIADHPELGPGEKKAKAEEILARAKNGEDFAALANEFSQDPGNKNENGEPQGGIYKDVTKGRMVAPFEQAALSVEPGQVVPNVVESDFGYHIIKLEKKGEGKDASGQPAETYDVRHILISTGFKDPENPMAREMPVKDYVRQKLETEKEKKLLESIIAQNRVSVPDDFDVPQISEEQLQESMRQQQQQMGMPEGDDMDAPPAAKKPETKPAPKKAK